jgi:hypothetical protein
MVPPMTNYTRMTILFGALILAIILPGCVQYKSPVMPPRGLIFTHSNAPLVLPSKETDLDQPIHYRKNTIHVQDWILTGLSIGAGDVALEEIAYEGNIEHIAYADYEFVTYLGFFSTYAVDIYGY